MPRESLATPGGRVSARAPSYRHAPAKTPGPAEPHARRRASRARGGLAPSATARAGADATRGASARARAADPALPLGAHVRHALPDRRRLPRRAWPCAAGRARRSGPSRARVPRRVRGARAGERGGAGRP
jgi:hypothetical protein